MVMKEMKTKEDKQYYPYELVSTIYKSVEDILGKIDKEETGNKPYKESVNHPSHYGGKDNPYETIKVIDAWGLDFELGNAIKYISRAGKKDPTKTVEDLKKAIFYIQHEIDKIEAGKRV